MGEFEPIIKRADCGDGYGVAFVKRTTGTPAVTTQMEVRVDLNKDDGTADPRVILADGTSVTVDAGFVTKYEALKDGKSLPEKDREKICTELNPKSAEPWYRPYVLHGSMVGSLLLRTGSYVVEDKFYIPMRQIAGFDDNPTRLVVFGLMTGMDFGSHAMYVSMHKKVSPVSRYVYDGVYGASALATGIYAGLGGGDPALQHSIQAFNTITSANMTTYLGDGYGALYQLGLGGLEIGLAFAVPTQPKVPESQAYVDPKDAGDHYHVSGNPHSPIAFPGLKANLLRDGGSMALWGIVQGIGHLAGADPAKMDKARAVSVDLLPDRGGSGIGGAFVGVDVGRVFGWAPPGAALATEY